MRDGARRSNDLRLSLWLWIAALPCVARNDGRAGGGQVQQIGLLSFVIPSRESGAGIQSHKLRLTECRASKPLVAHEDSPGSLSERQRHGDYGLQAGDEGDRGAAADRV